MSDMSRKDLARQLRRQAYQNAKQRAANDPRRLAMKEAAKLRRKEIYRQFKDRRDAKASGEKAQKKALRVEALMTLLSRGSEKTSAN